MKRQPTTRRGLAPLELVLVLPVLLFVMALMINLGTAGAWKIRTQVNARQAAWRSLEHRGGRNDPHPGNWPADADLDVSSTTPSPLPFDPFAGHDVVRGPVVADPATGEFLPVKTGYLEMQPDLLDGTAKIRRPYPLLARLPGELAFRRDHVIFDGTRFQFSSMNLGSNTSRRAQGLYPLELAARSPEKTREYRDAALMVITDPNEADLLPLTGGDPEVRNLTGRRSPNFQPPLLTGNDWRMTTIPQVRTRVPDYCEADPATVRSEKVEPVLREIHNVPHALSDYYLGVYQRVIDQLESLDPKPPGVLMQIQDLKAKRDQVRQFRASLPPRK